MTTNYLNVPVSQETPDSSRRTSASSSRSLLSFKNVMEQLKPTEEVIQPTGVYSGLTKNRAPLFDWLKPADKVEKPARMYDSVLRRPLFSRAKPGNEMTLAESRRASLASGAASVSSH